MARPRKPPGEKVLRGHFSYRPDQEGKVRDLASKKQLSGVIQRAIDAELVLEEGDPRDIGNRLAERALEKVKIEMKLG